MDNGASLKKVTTGGMIVFDDPDRLCLVLKGRIITVAPGQRQEVGPGGMIGSSVQAYAAENSELLFINPEKLRELRPDLAARIIDSKPAGTEVRGKRPEAGENRRQEVRGQTGAEAGSQKKTEAEKSQIPASDYSKPVERTAYAYSVDVQCPVCGDHFQASKLFESKLKQLNHDTELRTRFEDIEPIHYKAWVCPGCLYANFMNRFSGLSASQRSSLQQTITSRKDILAGLPKPGGNTERAINDYRLVIECLTQIKAPANVTASAWLNLAWLYDDAGDVEAATAARQNSLAAYEQFYFQERSLTPSMEFQALYIIGELNKRLGNIRKAHEYFLKVLHYKGHNMAMLTELARDSLQELKNMAKETA